MADGFRLACSAAATLELEGPLATVPLANAARIVAAALDAAGVVPRPAEIGIAEVAVTCLPAVLMGTPGSSAATIALRLESVFLFKRCNSARISEACW
jgi:hypothetical protein